MVLLSLAAAKGPPPEAAPAAYLEIHPAVHLVVNNRGDLLFQVRAAAGDGWTHLADRFAGSRDDWQALKTVNGGGTPLRGHSYQVPYALLRREYRVLGIAALFPDDLLDQDGWHHKVGSARLRIEEESLYRLAFWFTGDGENFRKLMTVNHLEDPELSLGQEILIPAELLDESFRMTPSEGNRDLTYGRDPQGAYASYKLKAGEALYSAVVLRFTGRVEPADVETLVKRIARRSGIKDVKDIPAGFEVRIPLEDLADEFRPPTDPQRVKLQMDRLLASKYRSSIRSQDLAGMTIILDPGHGGSDIGTRKNGVWEDDTVYDIAIRLEQKLRHNTAAQVRLTVLDKSQKDHPHAGRFTSIDRDEVILTTPHHMARDPASRAVSVNLRAFLASSIYRDARHKGGRDEQILFISLHADALHPSVRGAMVYIPGERFLRRRYGASGRVYRRYREVREKPYLSFNRSQRLRSEGLSRQFAEQIVRSFKKKNLAVHHDQPIRDHIVRKAHSWVPAVLRGNQVPIKVLVEVANIASKKDSRLLATSRQRDHMAAALLDAILNFYRAREQPALS